jgi:aminopeptidase N
MLRGEKPDPRNLLLDVLAILSAEKDPLISDYLLGCLENLWWTFFTTALRAENQLMVEKKLWTWLQKTNDKGMKSSYFRTYRSIAMSDASLKNLEKLWDNTLVIPGLTLSEEDKINLTYDLALKVPSRQKDFLTEQLSVTKNPDRVERMKFVSPALSDDEKVRDAFFESLKEERNREHEAWVLEALSYLHHPLRQESSRKYLVTSLELLQEIQLTGDIFFPQRWLNATFDGSNAAGLEIVEEFLQSHPDYPSHLLNKILQAIDMTERARAGQSE